jgi:hypothetical protein
MENAEEIFAEAGGEGDEDMDLEESMDRLYARAAELETGDAEALTKYLGRMVP